MFRHTFKENTKQDHPAYDPLAARGVSESTRAFRARITNEAIDNNINKGLPRTTFTHDDLAARNKAIHDYMYANDPYYAAEFDEYEMSNAKRAERARVRKEKSDAIKARRAEVAANNVRRRAINTARKLEARERLSIERAARKAERAAEEARHRAIAALARKHGRTPDGAVRKRRTRNEKVSPNAVKPRLTREEQSAVRERLDRIARQQVKLGELRRLERQRKLYQPE